MLELLMKTTTLRRLPWLALPLLAVRALGFSSRSSQPGAAAPPAAAQGATHGAAPAASAASLPGGDEDRFRPGYERRYAIDVSQEAQLSTGDSPAKPLLDTRVRGDWSVASVSRDGELTRFRAALTNVSIELAGSADQGGPFRTDLTHPFWFDTDREGRIVNLYFDRGVEAEARGFLRATAASLQVVTRPGAEWTTVEQDATGEYESRYTRGDEPGRLEKTRTRYTRLATGEGLRPAAEVADVTVEDDIAILLSPDDEMTSLVADAKTHLRMRAGLGTIVLRSRVTAQLRQRGIAPSPPEELARQEARLDRVEVAAGFERQSPEDAAQVADRQVVNGATLRALVRDLRAVPASAPKERGEAIARLTAAFRLRPADADGASSIAIAASPENAAAITAALGGAGTAPAQLALVDIASSTRASTPVRTNAVVALALQVAPTRETASSLRRLQSSGDADVRTGATLALGAVARAMKGSDAETADGLVVALLRELRAERVERNRAVWLRALGNAGDARVLPLAREALSSSDEIVRIAAAASVRFVAGPEADRLLEDAMTRDAAPNVRMEALGIVEGFRALPSYLPLLGTVVKADDSPAVRRAAVHALGRLRADPDALALLRDAAENDESEDVRVGAIAGLDAQAKEAAEALTSLPERREQ
jgi:HEAT repeat protein